MPNVFRFRRTSVPPEPNRNSTAIYADGDVLKQVASDGTVSNVAGAGSLPSPSSEGDVLTVVEGEWTGEAPSGGSQTFEYVVTDYTIADVINQDDFAVIGPVATVLPGDALLAAGFEVTEAWDGVGLALQLQANPSGDFQQAYCVSQTGEATVDTVSGLVSSRFVAGRTLGRPAKTPSRDMSLRERLLCRST